MNSSFIARMVRVIALAVALGTVSSPAFAAPTSSDSTESSLVPSISIRSVGSWPIAGGRRYEFHIQNNSSIPAVQLAVSSSVMTRLGDQADDTATHSPWETSTVSAIPANGTVSFYVDCATGDASLCLGASLELRPNGSHYAVGTPYWASSTSDTGVQG